MNSSSVTESQSEAIDFKDFTSRRMLHVVLPLFIVSIIAFLDRVNIAYAGLTMKENLPWLTPEVFGMGAGIFFIGYVLFEVPASLIAARCNALGSTYYVQLGHSVCPNDDHDYCMGVLLISIPIGVM